MSPFDDFQQNEVALNQTEGDFQQNEDDFLQTEDDSTQTESNSTQNHTLLTRLDDILQTKYAARLSWDVHQSKLRLDDKHIDDLDLKVFIEKSERFSVNEKHLGNLAYKLAYSKPYSEVEEYLNKVYEKYKDDPLVKDGTILRQLVEKLHIQGILEQTYIVKFLIGCVARALNPGCKMDTALIFMGRQGIRKTTFFQALAGEGRFMTLNEPPTNKEALRQIYKYWIIEHGEFDSQLTPARLNKLKNYMSGTNDEIRPMYANLPKTRHRHFVSVGTTNKSDFLTDTTGNRRFWVAYINEEIDTDWVAANRDLIWARAVQRYKDGSQWHLTTGEQAQSDQMNALYGEGDTWDEIVLTFAEDQPDHFTITDVLEHLSFLPKNQTKGQKKRVADILRRNDYAEYRPFKEDGTRPCSWKKKK
jgi:predicted P-loop ATPase